MLTVEDVKALKVADLRKELKQRGLDATGKKDELAKRLADAVEEENLLGDVGPAPTDEAEPAAAPAAAAPVAAEPAKASPEPAKASPPPPAAPEPAAVEAPAKATASAAADDILGGAATGEAAVNAETSAETAAATKVSPKRGGRVSVADLSRLKYGGVLTEEEERILARAQRFGEVKGGKAKELLDRIEHAKEIELKRKRAERFGLVIAPELIREVKKVDRKERRERAQEAKRKRKEIAREEAEKKRQRAERFAKPVVPPEEEAKMKQRAERFGAK